PRRSVADGETIVTRIARTRLTTRLAERLLEAARRPVQEVRRDAVERAEKAAPIAHTIGGAVGIGRARGGIRSAAVGRVRRDARESVSRQNPGGMAGDAAHAFGAAGRLPMLGRGAWLRQGSARVRRIRRHARLAIGGRNE